MNSLLAKYLEEIAQLLEQGGDRHWASWLRQDADDLRSGDSRGAHHFLAAFGGMGSINDSYGYTPPNASEKNLTREEIIAKRLSAAWNLARALVGKR